MWSWPLCANLSGNWWNSWCQKYNFVDFIQKTGTGINKSGIWWVSSRYIPNWSHETFVEGLLALLCNMRDKNVFPIFSKVNLKAYTHPLFYFPYK